MLFWMFGALVFLLIIDIIILASWETKDPLYRTLKQVRSQPEYECFQVRYTIKQVDYPRLYERILKEFIHGILSYFGDVQNYL